MTSHIDRLKSLKEGDKLETDTGEILTVTQRVDNKLSTAKTLPLGFEFKDDKGERYACSVRYMITISRQWKFL